MKITHLRARRRNGTACNLPAVDPETTEDLEEVDCRGCRRTAIFDARRRLERETTPLGRRLLLRFLAQAEGRTPLPDYVYVASSWRNPLQPIVCATLAAAGIDHYDFRNPPGSSGFSWREVKSSTAGAGIPGKGSDWEAVDEYLRMVSHPRALEGFAEDFAAMQRADAFVLVLPCGKSAHLELGWAVGAGKRTAILLEDPCEPELMYRMVDHLSPSLVDLLGWLGVED